MTIEELTARLLEVAGENTVVFVGRVRPDDPTVIDYGMATRDFPSSDLAGSLTAYRDNASRILLGAPIDG